jgi:drug/metabolite transporter (DMT)-like permease
MNPVIGILLAVACALAGNVGFLYKHRGARAAPAVDMRRPLHTARSLFASPLFALGMLIAVAAWILHVAAMALAPLSLVQAVLAGGVVLLAVIAERVFGLRLGRRQWIGVGLTATGLLLLGVTVQGPHGVQASFSTSGMIAFQACLVTAGTLLIAGPRIGAFERQHGFMLGAAAGILFGVSDLAIKAISMNVGRNLPLGLLNPWTAVALAASIAAFYASAKALQDGDPVPVIAITGTAGNVAGIIGGIIVFADPMPGNTLALAVQCTAFALVLAAAWLMPAPIHAASPATSFPSSAPPRPTGQIVSNDDGDQTNWCTQSFATAGPTDAAGGPGPRLTRNRHHLLPRFTPPCDRLRPPDHGRSRVNTPRSNANFGATRSAVRASHFANQRVTSSSAIVSPSVSPTRSSSRSRWSTSATSRTPPRG